ncbi:MAG: response regulator [Minicystis sp.]
MTFPPMPGATRADSTLDTLLILSRSLTGAKQGGMLADALDVLLGGAGATRGAAYTITGDAIELVGERGLPASLRAALARLPLQGATWFPAQKAARTRKLVVDHDLGADGAGPIDRAALAQARWGQVIACPLASGREVYGVLVLAWPADEEPPYPALALVEIACNMIAVHMARRSDVQQRAERCAGDVRAARMAGLGVLARGFAEDLSGQLDELGRRFTEQQRLVDSLRARLLAREGDSRSLSEARTARAPDPTEALRPAREATARFLSAIQPSAPERLDLTALAADVLALAGPRLRRHRIEITLRASGDHAVVGRRGELIQLFVQLVLGMAGALDEAGDAASERGALIPRAFVLEVCRQGATEVVSLGPAPEDGARASFFEVGSEVGETGFDLALAKQIVIAHEGHIEVGPGESGGTRCSVVLPAAGSEIDRRVARARLAPGARRPLGDRPVLVWIDEDELLLEIMVHSLPELDIRVARSAAEATQLLSFGVFPALVLCNVRLPDRSGHALHADVERQTPRIAERFVFVTDGVVTPEIASYLIASGRPTLMRPINVDQVRALALRDPAAAARPVVTAPTLADTHPDARRAPTVPAVRAPAPSDDDIEPSALPIVNGAAPGLRDKETVPARPQAAAADEAKASAPSSAESTLVSGSSPAPAPAASTNAPQVVVASAPQSAAASHPGIEFFGYARPPGTRSATMRDQELCAIARLTADQLRREGPKRGAVVSSMLRERGLSETEAFAVLTYAIANGILIRDLPPSSLLRAPDPDQRKTVLVVDDDYDLRQTVREILQEEGYVVDTASNGREALAVLRRSNPPRVVVLDLMMPVMDGWQLLDELKRDDTLADIPVVVISASKRSLNAPGAREFLTKPLDYYKLVTTIDRSMAPRARA